MDELIKKLKSEAMAIAAPAFLATIDGLIEMGILEAQKGHNEEERKALNLKRKDYDRMRGKAYDTIIRLAISEAQKFNKNNA